jgi:hypothetical protein
MERMTMRTAGQVADAAAARLRVLVAGVWPTPAMALPCPVYGSAPTTSVPLSTRGCDVIGNAKPGTTGGFRLTDHLARRHPERSP